MLHRIPEDLRSSVFGKLAVQILREYHRCVEQVDVIQAIKTDRNNCRLSFRLRY